MLQTLRCDYYALHQIPDAKWTWALRLSAWPQMIHVWVLFCISWHRQSQSLSSFAIRHLIVIF